MDSKQFVIADTYYEYLLFKENGFDTVIQRKNGDVVNAHIVRIYFQKENEEITLETEERVGYDIECMIEPDKEQLKEVIDKKIKQYEIEKKLGKHTKNRFSDLLGLY